MRDLLPLGDDDLVRAIDTREKQGRDNDKALGRFQAVRADLSRLAWDSYAAALGCDSGPIAETGVTVFPLDRGIADRLLAAMMASPKAGMRPADFALGYMQTAPQQCQYMNLCNEYRALGPASMALLGEFAAAIGPQLEQHLGHRFRIASARQFQLVPREEAADDHVDGWPPTIRKLFILPRGAGTPLGTTRFRLRNGKPFTLDTKDPVWVVFENSVVWHAPVTGAQLRPTLELDIVPAAKTSLTPVDAGLAGWYPWFPTEAGLREGTRRALAQCLADRSSAGWKDRVKGLLHR